MSAEKTPAFLLVKIASPPTTSPVFMVLDFPIFDHNIVDGRFDEEHQRYYVEEHTCPTNLVQVEAVLWDGDSDPHGVLEYVAHVAKPEEWPDQPTYDHWCELFPMLPGGIVDGAPIGRGLLP